MSDLDDLLSCLPPVRDDGFSAAIAHRIAREQWLLQMLVWSAGLVTALAVLAFIPAPHLDPAIWGGLLRLSAAPAVAMVAAALALTWVLWGFLARE